MREEFRLQPIYTHARTAAGESVRSGRDGYAFIGGTGDIPSGGGARGVGCGGLLSFIVILIVMLIGVAVLFTWALRDVL